MNKRNGQVSRRRSRQSLVRAKALSQRASDTLSPALIAGGAIVLVLLLIVRSGTGAF